jgi:hypothetical protein
MITQVANPSSVPSAVSDYEAQNAHISAFNNIVNNQPFILTNSGGTGLPAIKLGAYIQYGGNLYVVDTEDYAITGTPVNGNNYIRLSGTTTLTAEWVQDISSYVWNEIYGYKESGSYFLLPYLVVKDGTSYNKYSYSPVYPSFTDQELRTTDSPTFAQITTTNGPNKPVDNNDASMPSVGIGGFSYAVGSTNTDGAYPLISIGSGGTWVYIAYSIRTTATSVRVGKLAGGSSVQGQFPATSLTAYVYVIAWRIA